MDDKRRMHSFFVRNRIWLALLWVGFLLLWLFAGGRVFLALCIVLPALSGISLLLQHLALRQLTVEVQMPCETVRKCEKICGTVVVHNPSALPMHRLFLELVCQNTYTLETQTLVLSSSLTARETVRVPFTVTAAHCGYLQVSLGVVKATELFGIAALSDETKTTAAGTPVFPDIYPVHLVFSPFSTAGYRQNDAEIAQKGDDLSQIFQLRSYAPGDSLRQIHWKLSEKYGSLITREGSADAKETLLVYWDPSESSDNPASADALAQAVASVCCALEDSGIAFRFAANPTDSRAFCDDATAEDIRFRILEAMRRPSPPSPLASERVGESRVLYFSMRRPEPNGHFLSVCGEANEQTLWVSPNHPLRELEV